MCKPVNIRVAGFGGQGVMMIGQLIAYCAANDNMFSLWVPSYGPETRGGTANCNVIVSTKNINSPVFTNADVLIAMNIAALTKFKDMLVPEGTLLYNSSMIHEPQIRGDIKTFGIPVNDIAVGLGTIQVSNTVMLGAFLESLGLFSDATAEKVLVKFLGEKKAHLLGINQQAIQAGERSDEIAQGVRSVKSVRELLPAARTLPKKTMVVVFAHDEFVMDAVKATTDAGIVSPILIGDAPLIERLIHELHITEPCKVLHETDGERASRIAVDLVNAGKADVVMKGLLDTKILLKAVVNSEWGIKDAKLLSHVGMVSFPGFDRVLFVTDGAMNITPTVDEKILILENAVKLAHLVGYPEPKVGIVSAVEKVNPKIQSTVDAEAIKEHYRQYPSMGFLVDGPFAVDNLVSPDSVKHKGIDSPVAGVADILLFPNLDGGNIFYKTSVFLGHGEAAGLVIGAKVPIVLTSRADSAETKSNSIALGVIYSHGLSHSRH